MKKGQKITEAHRQAISKYMSNRIITDEWRNKMRAIMTEKKLPLTPFSKGHTPWNVGVTHTEKTKEKIRIKRAKQVITIEMRRKMRESHLGDKSANWKGGITKESTRIRGSLEYKLWREAVYKRDNYTCVLGGEAHGKKLHVDHIRPFALYPELRFAIDNGRVLCVECHKKTPTYMKSWFTREQFEQIYG